MAIESEAGEQCQRCGDVDHDRRTLWMSCFYAMNELELPFEQHRLVHPNGHNINFFTLRVCKDCRADWMAAIKSWFDTPVEREVCGSGIFVRENGATREITREEWDRRNPGREPVVVAKKG